MPLVTSVTLGPSQVRVGLGTGAGSWVKRRTLAVRLQAVALANAIVRPKDMTPAGGSCSIIEISVLPR